MCCIRNPLVFIVLFIGNHSAFMNYLKESFDFHLEGVLLSGVKPTRKGIQKVSKS